MLIGYECGIWNKGNNVDGKVINHGREVYFLKYMFCKTNYWCWKAYIFCCHVPSALNCFTWQLLSQVFHMQQLTTKSNFIKASTNDWNKRPLLAQKMGEGNLTCIVKPCAQTGDHVITAATRTNFKWPPQDRLCRPVQNHNSVKLNVCCKNRFINKFSTIIAHISYL